MMPFLYMFDAIAGTLLLVAKCGIMLLLCLLLLEIFLLLRDIRRSRAFHEKLKAAALQKENSSWEVWK